MCPVYFQWNLVFAKNDMSMAIFELRTHILKQIRLIFVSGGGMEMSGGDHLVFRLVIHMEFMFAGNKCQLVFLN